MTAPLVLALARIRTPIGVMITASDAQDRLRAADWEPHEERMLRQLERMYRPAIVRLVETSRRLERGPRNGVVAAVEAYFDGDVRAIEALAVEAPGTTFQTAVWSALRQIPVGETWSYVALARHIGRPMAMRAVGLANRANPVGVVVPCHRVIGATGALTGYGGGLERKAWLLEHERAALMRGAA